MAIENGDDERIEVGERCVTATIIEFLLAMFALESRLLLDTGVVSRRASERLRDGVHDVECESTHLATVEPAALLLVALLLLSGTAALTRSSHFRS